MDICEKAAYLKGLAEGLGVDESTKEGKLLAAVVDLLGDITEEICDIEDGCDALLEQIDAVDEDLSAVEELVYDLDDDEEFCENCDDELYEVECPECGDVIYLDEEMLEDGSMACPNCGTELEFDFGDEDEVADEGDSEKAE